VHGLTRRTVRPFGTSLDEGQGGKVYLEERLFSAPAETIIKGLLRDREAILAFNDPADGED